MTTVAPAIEARNAGGTAGSPVKSPRILLVEDNRDILRATQRILAARNYEILTAMDGEAALEIARKERPDVILLDIMIPKLDGLEVCRQIKMDPRTSGTMILLVTGRATVDNRVQGLDAGADDYIPKPFHIPELLARVRSALRIKRLTDDLAERNQQLLKSQADLVQSEKMASIGFLASGIAHEFNNIMAGISGYAQLARKNPKFKDMLIEVALTQTERALDLTRSLSTYNRPPSQEQSESDVVEVLESALCLVANEVETSSVQIVKEFTSRPLVHVLAAELQEVILNLVINAIQAIRPNQGTIHIRVGTDADSKSCLIEVSDTGVGIPAENLRKIFDPFFTTKGALGGGRHTGTGLGLTVSYNVIKSHSGRIDVESVVGKGTTFRVTLPAAARSVARAGTPDVETSPTPTSNRPLKILIVDDETHVRDLLLAYLEGQDVHCVATGDLAVEAAAREPFDFVLLDVAIENSMNGFQTFDQLSRLPHVPKIIFASGRFPESAYQSYIERAHGHLLKPFKFEALAALLGLPQPQAAPVVAAAGTSC
ncbi:MAG TPA: response regulator [Planctomycetota bacterium]|nr:response regulator [Planctomycetota bacterium]